MVFYYPDRTSPTTTLTISALEKRPSARPVKKPEFLDVMAGGTKKHQALGTARQEILIRVEALPEADRASLVDFIENKIQWGAGNCDIDDGQGNEYNNCFYIKSQHRFEQHDLNLFREQLRFMVEPT